ncbi:hypothetical protein [Aeromonas hydrophila]|uniref:hypothetical protein n=1 Tax=Aeromonas hydrophila TaxID=644 RepID=UPI002B476F2A|nr:hypothetical protein [Aeromonas hydrophila]
MNFLWRFGLFSRQAAKKPTFSVAKQPFEDKRVVSLRFYAKKFPFHFFTQPRFPSPVADRLALLEHSRQQAHAPLAVSLKNKIQRGNIRDVSPKPHAQRKGLFVVRVSFVPEPAYHD